MKAILSFIALFAIYALSVLIFDGCHAAEWQQQDRQGYEWLITIPKHLDAGIEIPKPINAHLEAIATTKSKTVLSITITDQTDRAALDRWVNQLETDKRFEF